MESWKGVTSDGRVIGDIDVTGSVAGALRRQRSPPTLPYSAQLTPTASAKRRFFELQFLVKSFDVGYTRGNVNSVGIFGNSQVQT